MLSKSGKKQDLIDRIIHIITDWKMANNVEKWNKARAVFYQVRNSGMYSSSASTGVAAFTPSTYPTATQTKPYMGATVASSNVPRYDPFTSPRKPSLPSSSAIPAPKPSIRFKPSPFYKIVEMVSNLVECPESTSATDRRQSTLTFTLTPEHHKILCIAGSCRHQLRLYCTSSSYYALGRTNTNLCPIEFPPTCEVRINGLQINANMKGLKKKPGTAPPADLTRFYRNIGQNRLEMVYVNSQAPQGQPPPPPKKYYMAVMLVEVTTTEELIERLKKRKFRSSADIVANSTDRFIRYFEEILKATPDSVEDVVVEVDGEWHTSDNKYGSANWKASHVTAPPTTVSPSRSPSRALASSSAGPKADVEVFELDSDDDDEGRVNRELSPSWRAQSSMVSQPPDSQVIDLTGDSDDEEPVPVRPTKRKAVDDVPSPTEQIWKKSRVDPPPSTVMRSFNGNVNTSASASSPSGSNIGARPSHLNGVPSQLSPSNTPQLSSTYPNVSFAPPYIMPYYSTPNSTLPSREMTDAFNRAYIDRAAPRWPS
ncbi:hypothetical protein EWM64_g1371 [Hericium alpestre]|uniref:PINIT domain-containing protein n=1 Tax=Hericium alpestre TaxID=135208 RepID=A0A4Z0A822_9AGAM|nr:hypothetical protein EWM64_g1371 [Hericium alpestre]